MFGILIGTKEEFDALTCFFLFLDLQKLFCNASSLLGYSNIRGSHPGV